MLVLLLAPAASIGQCTAPLGSSPLLNGPLERELLQRPQALRGEHERDIQVPLIQAVAPLVLDVVVVLKTRSSSTEPGTCTCAMPASLHHSLSCSRWSTLLLMVCQNSCVVLLSAPATCCKRWNASSACSTSLVPCMGAGKLSWDRIGCMSCP